jgi:hypothetical protein
VIVFRAQRLFILQLAQTPEYKAKAAKADAAAEAKAAAEVKAAKAAMVRF